MPSQFYVFWKNGTDCLDLICKLLEIQLHLFQKCVCFNSWLFYTYSAVIGEIDEETDSALDLGNIRAEPLNSVAH